MLVLLKQKCYFVKFSLTEVEVTVIEVKFSGTKERLVLLSKNQHY